MSAAQAVRERYVAKSRALCLQMFRAKAFRTLSDAQAAMAKEPPPGYVEEELRLAPGMARSGRWFMSAGAMSAEDLEDLQFYETVVQMLERESR